MLQEIIGRTVKIYLTDQGAIGGFMLGGLSDPIKGEVVAVRDPWLKLQTKKGVEFINLAKVRRISASLQ